MWLCRCDFFSRVMYDENSLMYVVPLILQLQCHNIFVFELFRRLFALSETIPVESGPVKTSV